MGEIESLTRCGTQRGGAWTGLLLNDVISDVREDRIREGFCWRRLTCLLAKAGRDWGSKVKEEVRNVGPCRGKCADEKDNDFLSEAGALRSRCNRYLGTGGRAASGGACCPNHVVIENR